MDIKKELKDIAWNVPEETYRQDPAISYSTLAKLKEKDSIILNICLIE